MQHLFFNLVIFIRLGQVTFLLLSKLRLFFLEDRLNNFPDLFTSFLLVEFYPPARKRK